MLKSCSVAMAVCNGEKYLEKQISSILEQLAPVDELVISYDESSDRTLSLILNFSELDDRVRVIRNDCPGIVGNFNNAINACCKDVIFISDQDDIWMPGKRNEILHELNETEAELVIHNVVHIDGGGSVISKPLFEEFGIKNGWFRNFLAPRYSGCCMAFPASSKRLVYPMPSSVINYDHWIGMVCETYGRVVFDDRVFLEHRLHGMNATTPRRRLDVILGQRIRLLLELYRRRKLLM